MLHTGLSFAIAFLVLVVVDLSDRVLHWTTLLGVPSYLVSNIGVTIFHLHMGIAVYWVLTAGRHATVYHDELKDRELRTSQLEAQLARGQLSALKAQLQPHFLFNSLNSVAVLMRRDSAAAETMLHRIANLLRVTLDTSDHQLLPLDQEIEFARTYLSVEQTRFQDRLSHRIAVSHEAARALVPNLLLQPLVENALKHGVAPLAAGGTVEITATRVDEILEIRVTDDGAGLGNSGATSEGGIGLDNTRRRLEALYGNEQTFDIVPPKDGGTEVIVTLPYRPAPASTTPDEVPAVEPS